MGEAASDNCSSPIPIAPQPFTINHQPSMTGHIAPNTEPLLVRHGETIWNAAHRVQGHTDIPLSERGLAQAHLLAPRLAREPIRALYASDLSRAVQTAEPAAAL